MRKGRGILFGVIKDRCSSDSEYSNQILIDHPEALPAQAHSCWLPLNRKRKSHSYNRIPTLTTGNAQTDFNAIRSLR